MFCKNCGKEIDDQAEVCMNCGVLTGSVQEVQKKSAMKKAKLGISIGLLAAAVYFLGLFGGYVITGILVGYILLVEEDKWLKKQGIKVIALMLAFSLLGLIPDAIDFINSFFRNPSSPSQFYYKLININEMIRQILSILKIVVFAVLGFRAFVGATVKIPVIDEIIDKNIE